MAFTPESVVHLCRVNFDQTNKNQVTFNSEYAQYSYFYQKRVFSYEGLTYQRKDAIIRYEGHADNLWNVNYCMYRNSNFTNKWFYAFVTEIEYVNDNMTYIHIKTDVWQTWYWNIIIQNCFVEREHVNSDTVGENLIPENTELGELVASKEYSLDLGDFTIVLATSTDVEGKTVNGDLVQGVYSGLQYRYYSTSSSGINNLNTILSGYAAGGKLDAVVSIFMMPSQLISGSTVPVTFSLNTTFGSYTPRNNKLLTSPYNTIRVSNNNGDVGTYYPELFSSPLTATFSMKPAFSIQPVAGLFPTNYKNIAENHDEPIILSGFPQCAWVGDLFANWYAQTRATRNVGYVSNGLSFVGNLLTGNAGGVVNSLTSAAQNVASIYDRNTLPDTVRGLTNCDSANITWDRMTFNFTQMQVKEEFARKIDRFFSVYGYAIGYMKKPNILGRPNWNFVKCSDVNIQGNIPQNDLDEIMQIFLEGVTFWHNGDIIGNYDLANEIDSPPIPPPDPEPEPEPGEEFFSPVGGEWENAVTSEFGWRDYPPDPYHTGIDLNIQYGLGSPIYSALAGKVVNVIMSNVSFGNRVRIQHEEGILTMYAHCDTIIVNVGDTVVRGQKIGTIGQSGLATGPHLHFQVELNGVPVNPRDYLV